MSTSTARPAAHPRRRGEKGQVLTLVALVMVSLLGMLGLAVDGGALFYHRRHAQSAADAAARAASVHLYSSSRDETAARQAALDYAAANEFDNSGGDNTVAVNIPPTTGSFVGNTNYVEVEVSRTFTTALLGILSRDLARASARAVAGIRGQASDIGVLTLSSSACPGLEVSSNAQFNVTGGRVVSNSTCSDGIRVSSTAQLTAPAIQVAGGYRRDPSATISPTPQTGTSTVADPLALLAAPSFSGLTVRHGTASSPSTWEIQSGTTTLYPGIYYGGLYIHDTATVTFQPGTYIMAGGGFTVGGTPNVTGTGVFIYISNDPSLKGIEMEVESPGRVQLSAPTSGAYAGVLFFQDRSNSRDFKLRGPLNALTGTLYAPSAFMEVRISAGGAHVAQVIVKSFKMTENNTSLTVNYDSSAAYRVPKANLTE